MRRVEHGEHRIRKPDTGRASAHSRLAYAKKIVEPEAEDEEVDQEEEENGTETFEALTVEEVILISGSSESIRKIEQTYGDRKTQYREIVEKLIRRTGVLCKDNMDKNQRKFLKRKVITDFRRQVVPRPHDYMPHDYNAGGTLERY